MGWLPDDPTVRTLTGQFLAVALVYYLYLCPNARWGQQTAMGRQRLSYAGLTVGAVVFLQVAVRLPWAKISTLFSGLALMGLLVLVGLSVATMVAVVSDGIAGRRQ